MLTLCLTHSLPPSLLSYSVNMEVIRHYFISTTIGELVHCLATMAVVFGVDVWGSLSNLVGMFCPPLPIVINFTFICAFAIGMYNDGVLMLSLNIYSFVACVVLLIYTSRFEISDKR